MFEHFTFGAQAQTQPEGDEPFPSPTDCSFKLEIEIPPTSSYNSESSKGEINDIVSQLSAHSLHPDDDETPQRSIWNTVPTPDFSIDTDNEMTDFTAEELTYISTGRGKVTLPISTHSHSVPNLSSTPKHGTVACRRLQRQLNTQLQSNTSHIKDISTLVEDMIENSSQCRLIQMHSRPSPSPLPFVTEPLELDADENLQQQEAVLQLHEDEGFAEMEDDEMTLRRASTPMGIRKWNATRFRESGEFGGGGQEGAWMGMGRRKVRCVPRMRKRKVKTVVE